MVGSFTNESAIAALSILRSANLSLDETTARIATGLEVRRSSDNPAFFLVAQSTRADLAVIREIANNLSLSIESVSTASNGVAQLFDSLDRITNAVVTADADIALDELQFAVANEVSFIRQVVQTTSFAGVNLLAGSTRFSFTTGYIRNSDALRLQTTDIDSLNLAEDRIAGDQLSVIGFPFPTSRAEAEARAAAALRSFSPAVADALDADGDGVLNLTDGSSDDADGAIDNHFTLDLEATGLDPREAVVALPFAMFSGGTARFSVTAAPGGEFPSAVAFFNAVYIPADPSFLELADTTGDGFVDAADDLDGDFSNGLSIRARPVDADVIEAIGFQEFDFSNGVLTVPIVGNAFAAPTNADGYYIGTARDVVVFAVATDQLVRDFAEASTFAGALNFLDVDNTFISKGAILSIVDVLREKLNFAASQLGTVEATLLARQGSLSNLADSLEVGIASLVEADLDEEQGRLSAGFVRRLLAAQQLVIANAQPALLLQLLRPPSS